MIDKIHYIKISALIQPTHALSFLFLLFPPALPPSLPPPGHNVRYAVSRVDARGAKEEGKEGAGEEDEVPTLLLVHGFGASSDQWSKCFEALSELTITDKKLQNGFRVFALDLLGFGHSEKPSVTYTQYLWQDQVRDFALEVVKSPFFIAGNSIGGFTAASVAADIGPMCQGLILVNTAGKVVSPEVSLVWGGEEALKLEALFVLFHSRQALTNESESECNADHYSSFLSSLPSLPPGLRRRARRPRRANR